MPRSSRGFLASLAVLAAGISFGTLGPLSRFAGAGGLSGPEFAAWRAGIATLATAALILLLRRNVPVVPWRSLDRQTWLALLVATASGATLNLALFSAFQRIPVALALLVFYTYPALVAVAGRLLGRETLGPGRLAALSLSLSGMVLVVWGAGPAGAAGGAVDPLGLGLAAVASLSQTLYVTMSTTAYRAVPSHQAVLVILAGSAAAMAAAATILGGGGLDRPFHLPWLWGPLVTAGVIGAALPSLLLLIGIRRIGSTRAAILALAEPVTGAILAALLLGETLSGVQIAGAGLVLGGAAVLQMGRATGSPRAASGAVAAGAPVPGRGLPEP